PNALSAGRIASGLVRGETSRLTLLYVQSTALSIFHRLWQKIHPDLAGKNLQEQIDLIKAYGEEQKVQVEVRREADSDAVAAICKEAARGHDLLLIGAGARNPLRSAITTQILATAPCHVGLVRGRGPLVLPRGVLVVTNGSYFSLGAVELA